MIMRVRKEEYTNLGEFVRVSFVRDLAAIEARFPKLNAAFLEKFTAKLEEVKALESAVVLTLEQEITTTTLYAEAGELNRELNFLKSYIEEIGLDINSVMALKNDLVRNNIEDALLKMEPLKQFVRTHLSVLTAEGMEPDFTDKLEAHKVSLAEKNALQNSFINHRNTLTDMNMTAYNTLFDCIKKIMKAGKLVFEDKPAKEEYILEKTVNRMRVAKLNEVNKAA